MEHIHLPAPSQTDVERLDATKLALRRSGYHSLTRIECEVRGGMVVLSGQVPSYYMKQLAQTVVQQLTFVETLENQIRVAGNAAR